MQGGPHDHITAAKAVAFGEALLPEFETYTKQVIVNARRMSDKLKSLGYNIVSGGTDNHLFVVSLVDKNVSGKEVEKALEKAGISVSRSTIPNDPNPPMNPSGLRIGTAAVTTRGMKESEMDKIAIYIDEVIKNKDNDDKLLQLKGDLELMCSNFPLPTERE
jgi:glycine hydroxymethyltransferase